MEKSTSKLEEVICLGHFLGDCPKCKPHEGPEHPNNHDCVRYIPVTVRYLTAVDSKED